jgi:hypothetical protein
MGQQDSSMQRDPKTRQVPKCRTCLAEDGVSNSKVLEKVIRNPMHKNRHSRIVCAVCWERGRETPVTCRTFVPAGDRQQSETLL